MNTQEEELQKDKERLLKKMRRSTNGLKKIAKDIERFKEKVSKEEKDELEIILIELEDIIARQEKSLEDGDINAYLSIEADEVLSKLENINTKQS